MNELNISKEQLANLKKYMLYNYIGNLNIPLNEKSGKNTVLDYTQAQHKKSIIDTIYR